MNMPLVNLEIVSPKRDTCIKCGNKKDSLRRRGNKRYYREKCKKCHSESNLNTYYKYQGYYQRQALDHYHMYRAQGMVKGFRGPSTITTQFQERLKQIRKKKN